MVSASTGSTGAVYCLRGHWSCIGIFGVFTINIRQRQGEYGEAESSKLKAGVREKG
jgi:hypothetical protein